MGGASSPLPDFAAWREPRRRGQDVARSHEGEKILPSGILLHGGGIQDIPIELPLAGHRMECLVTMESSRTALAATFDRFGDLQTKGPTELSDRPIFVARRKPPDSFVPADVQSNG
jgi:hypothetical protein